MAGPLLLVRMSATLPAMIQPRSRLGCIQWNWAQPNRERGWIIAGNVADILTSSSGPAIDGTPFAPINYVINSTWRLLPAGSPNPHHWRVNEFSWYAQDDYKIRRNLTLNLGLRWEYDGWPTDAG